MGQDIRELLKEDEAYSEHLKKGHKQRFGAKLEKAFPKETATNTFYFWKIAAVLVVVVGVGLALLLHRNATQENVVVEVPVEEHQEEPATKQFRLSNVSPEFKKIENYYLAGLHIELANLEINESNKALVDSFMKQLAKLEEEYQRLNKEFSQMNANEQTVEAMILNLQLRLELLFKLKNKIKEIKQQEIKDYENVQA